MGPMPDQAHQSADAVRPGKVLVAMSGGVDSSVAAALLKQQGHEVVGCFMRLGSPGDSLDELIEDAGDACRPGVRIGKQGCCSVNDAADARLVAAKLDIPFYVCNFKRDFGRIIDYFVGEYNAGRTPNPCVRCNDWLKFGKLHEYARQIDADYIASGHYARIDRAGDRPVLRRGVDHGKDQSYVLFGASRKAMDQMLLPIGEMRKDIVRELAASFDLPVHDKPDSQEICFVPDNDYAALVQKRSPEMVHPGDILDPEGNVVGEHPGQQHFTIGQRRRVGVALGYPIYVTNKNAESNTITVGPREDLAASGLCASDTTWHVDPPTDWMPCFVKIRYNARPVRAELRAVVDGDSSRPNLEVRFERAQDAVAPGQAAVCYDADTCDAVLVGGWIDQAL
jgi:tRNA-specific 2-thiouridylase